MIIKLLLGGAQKQNPAHERQLTITAHYVRGVFAVFAADCIIYIIESKSDFGYFERTLLTTKTDGRPHDTIPVADVGFVAKWIFFRNDFFEDNQYYHQ